MLQKEMQVVKEGMGHGELSQDTFAQVCCVAHLEMSSDFCT